MKFRRIIALLMASTALLSGCGNKSIELMDTEVANLGNTSGNISNQGAMCTDGDSIYYQKSDDDLSMYKSDINGENETKLNSAQSYFINVYKDKIYYSNGSDEFNVYTMDKDGKNNKCIIKSPANYLTIYKDKIYYSNVDDNSTVYSADLDGSNPKKIVDFPIFYLTAYKDMIYFVNYADNCKIYQAELDGKNMKAIVEDYCAYLNLYNDYVYYTTPPNPKTGEGNDTVHRYSIIDHTIDDVLSVSCGDLNIANDRIYFHSLGDKKIFSTDLEGKDVKEIAADPGLFINVAGKELSYVLKEENQPTKVITKEIE